MKKTLITLLALAATLLPMPSHAQTPFEMFQRVRFIGCTGTLNGAAINESWLLGMPTSHIQRHEHGYNFDPGGYFLYDHFYNGPNPQEYFVKTTRALSSFSAQWLIAEGYVYSGTSGVHARAMVEIPTASYCPDPVIIFRTPECETNPYDRASASARNSAEVLNADSERDLETSDRKYKGRNLVIETEFGCHVKVKPGEVIASSSFKFDWDPTEKGVKRVGHTAE